jgi:Protein of unknown function (DUF3277)
MSSQGTTTYSFKDTTGSFSDPLNGDFILTGENLGAGKFEVKNTARRSALNVVSDGTAVTEYISDNTGEFTCECQQTSALHKYFLACANLQFTAADNQDVSMVASRSVHLQNIVDGSQHVITGVSIVKIPDKAYAKQSGMLTWEFLASRVANQ